MKIITDLQETKMMTLGYFSLNDTEFSKRYGIGKWNVREILIHLADAESVLHERLKRTISQPKPLIIGFDQDLWYKNLDYPTFPIDISKSLYESNRNSVIYLAEKFYTTLGTKEFVHNETGLRTLKNEFDKIVSHNISHIEQIEQALKGNQ